MFQIVLYFLHSTSVLSIYMDVVLTLSTRTIRPWLLAPVPTDLIIGHVNQQLTEQAHLERRTAGTTMSRLKIYSDCGFQSPVTPDEPALYIRSILSRTQRSHIAGLRTGTLTMAIETGWYRHIPANERLCKYCTAGEVEDEFLILLTSSFVPATQKSVQSG